MSTPRLERLAETLAGAEYGDADSFCESVGTSAFFRSEDPIAVARAPGRLDVLGGIADYSGSLVLELPLAAAALAAAQLDDDGSVVAVSGDRRTVLDADDLTSTALDGLAARFTGTSAWAAYVLGPIALFLREENVSVGGLRILVSSDVPEAKGVGSSAAIGVAALQAVAACLGRAPEPRRLALLSQRAEQLLASAPCGSMDQMTAAYGERDHLLLLLCRPAEIVARFRCPTRSPSGASTRACHHAVAGTAYRRARCAAFMGKALLGCREEYLAAVDPAGSTPNSSRSCSRAPTSSPRHSGIDDPACRDRLRRRLSRSSRNPVPARGAPPGRRRLPTSSSNRSPTAALARSAS